VIREPDPTVPDPVKYFKAMAASLSCGYPHKERPRFETPPLTRWMEWSPHG